MHYNLFGGFLRKGENMNPEEYQEFLQSMEVIFNAAIKSEDWKLALQVKTLEAKCRGFFKNKIKETKDFSRLSDDDLKEILISINNELAEGVKD